MQTFCPNFKRTLDKIQLLLIAIRRNLPLVLEVPVSISARDEKIYGSETRTYCFDLDKHSHTYVKLAIALYKPMF